METFDYDGKSYISINGKDYFLVRGYRKNNDRFIFVQVFGKTPLHKEDMPGKDWEIVRTKSGDGRVYTAYRKKYFKYDTEAANPTLVFVGASTQGSFCIALSHIRKRFCLDVSDEILNQRAVLLFTGEKKDRSLETIRDDGNTNVKAVLIEFDRFFDEEKARNIFGIGDEDDE